MILFDGIGSKWSFNDVEGLKTYLNQVWQNRPLFLSEEEDEDEKRSTEQKFFIFSNEYIRPKNYVGFVQYGDLRLNIYPRVFYNHPVIDISENPLPAINHVLKWLSYSNRVHFPFNEVPLQLQSQDDWLEALIYLFANYTSNILSSSPYFAYQELTEEMAFVRGRIAMPQYINQNLSKGRHHLLHCTYEPFLYDNQFNRIVKHTCRLLQNATSNDLNRDLLNDILFLLDEVSDVYCTTQDCAKVPVNRLYPEISAITNMCASFLSNQAYSDGIANNQNLCILLPMEVIYEQYIAGFICEHFPHLEAQPQASGEYVAKTGQDFSKNVFQMRHDILLPDSIIDTKYKFRNSDDENKGGVSQNDIYQMVTYCYKRNMKNGMLLYPKHFDEEANNESNKFKIEARAGDIIIDACSIDITEEDFEKFELSQKMKVEVFLKESE
jgi:5-methylcytosine-specific restriction enzyme subunit McrC